MTKHTALPARLKFTMLATVAWAALIYVAAAGGGALSAAAWDVIGEHLAPVTFVLSVGGAAILVGLSFLLQNFWGGASVDRVGRWCTTVAVSIGTVLCSFLLGFGLVAFFARMVAVGSMAVVLGAAALWIGLALEQRLRRHRRFEPNQRAERLLAGVLLIVSGAIYASLPFAERRRGETLGSETSEQATEGVRVAPDTTLP